jgi:L-threonylcarbamoyladenylate synthase
MLEPFVQPISEEVISKLIKPYWPGGLTIVMPCYPEKISALIRGGTMTLGVRVPDHLTTIALIEGTGVPIIGTSANFSGRPTPYVFEDLDSELVQLVDYVVPGQCYKKKASTVIDVSEKPWKILREGAVTINL